MDRPSETVFVIHERGRRRAGHSTLIRYATEREDDPESPTMQVIDAIRTTLRTGPAVYPNGITRYF